MALSPKMIETAIDNLDCSLTGTETNLAYDVLSREVTVWEMANRTDATQETVDLALQVALAAYNHAIGDVQRRLSDFRFDLDAMTSY